MAKFTLRKLTDDEFELVTQFVGEFGLEKTAEIMGISESTVKRQSTRIIPTIKGKTQRALEKIKARGRIQKAKSQEKPEKAVESPVKGILTQLKTLNKALDAKFQNLDSKMTRELRKNTEYVAEIYKIFG